MQLWEIIGLFVCVLAVIGFYTLACVVARCLSFREKMTVGVRVLEEDDADGVYQKLALAGAAVSSKVGFEDKPVILLDPSICPSELCRELYIELGEFDIFVKMKIPPEEQ